MPKAAKAEKPAKKAAKKVEKPTKAKKEKKAKDPNAPKKPMGAYMWFCKDKRDEVKKSHPGAGVADIAKELGAMWKNVKDKKKYEAEAAKDKERYEKVRAPRLAHGWRSSSNCASVRDVGHGMRSICTCSVVSLPPCSPHPRPILCAVQEMKSYKPK